MVIRNCRAVKRATVPTFALGDVEFELVPQWSVPGRVVNYHIRYGCEEIILTVVFIRSALPYGPRSNIDLTYYTAPRYIFSRRCRSVPVICREVGIE